jgi:hypothetical protein
MRIWAIIPRVNIEQMEWDGGWVPRAMLEKMGIVPADEIAEGAALKLTEEEKRV